MATQNITLTAQLRSQTGKKVRTLRRDGITPIHVYGQGLESLALQVDAHTLQRTLAQVGRTVPVTLQVAGDEHFVFVREVQRHPVTEQLLHVDFLQVSRTERITTDVPIELEGEAPGGRHEGAMLMHDLYAVSVEALPADLPPVFHVDISGLEEIDDAIRVGDLSVGSTVSILTDPEQIVVRIARQRVSVEVAEGAEAPAGEAVAAAGESAEEAPPA